MTSFEIHAELVKITQRLSEAVKEFGDENNYYIQELRAQRKYWYKRYTNPFNANKYV